MAVGDFLSCDWGTTTFRLRWICGKDRQVLREIREQAGVRSLYEEAARRGAETATARAPIFAGFLRAKLDALFEEQQPPSQPLPLAISGMASSSVGWRELPYGKTPAPLDGRGLSAEELPWEKPDWLGRTYLISGLATEHEMMRGEETEITGLMAEPSLSALGSNCLLILPGTHSKHVRIKSQSIIDWRTFMTGELFEVLGRHSLLRASVVLERARGPLSEPERLAFREGVRWAETHGFAGGLFRVRTRAVLGRKPLPENTWFFSGILIGAELSGLGKDTEKPPVIVAAAGHLAELYALALETLAEVQWIQPPPKQIEAASIAAHALFLQRCGEWSIPADKPKRDRER